MSDIPNQTSQPAATDSATPPAAAAEAGGFTKEQLKSAYNAFKKRLKLTRLDDESRVGRSPMSGGQKSTIAGIVPPDQFPAAIWEALAEQGRIKRAGRGFYTM